MKTTEETLLNLGMKSVCRIQSKTEKNQIIKKTVWVIMTKDRKYIAKGVPRNRWLISVDDKEDNKRVLTYTTKKKAENGFKLSGFYCGQDKELEAVKCSMALAILTDPH
jgi:uncharacterized protein with PIN domain